MYENSCLVELASANAQCGVKKSTDQNTSDDITETATCSGIVLSHSHGYILTHGSLAVSFFDKHRDKLERLIKNGHLPGAAFQDHKAQVTLEKFVPKVNKTQVQKGWHQTLFNLTSSKKIDKPSELLSGAVELVWRADRFSRCVKNFLPSNDDWSFFEDPVKNDKSEKGKNGTNYDIDPNLVAILLPYFVLIRISNWPNNPGKRLSIHDGSLHARQRVNAVGTPFGSMSPSVFLNSVSQGIICKLIGPYQELILTDARCIPGCEGGPISSGPDTRSVVVGVVVSALCWKANEWIGLSLACNIKEVLRSLSRVVKYPEIANSIHLSSSSFSSRNEYKYSQMDTNNIPVALVKCGGSWGSGVLVDQSKALVLTCGHVLKDSAKGTRVRFDQPSTRWYDGEVIYKTPNGYAFDIGLIKLNDYTSNDSSVLKAISLADSLHTGEECYVVGHALFGHHLNFSPSVTSGVISKIVTSHNFPVMLQSTCTVNAGASGGPLVSNSGKLLGIVVCNARDTATGASYPNINLSVPAETIWPVIQQYITNSDPSVFEVFNLSNTDIMASWRLTESTNAVHHIGSKL